MSAETIDGKSYAVEVRQSVAGHVARLLRENGLQPGLAVVIVGEDPASRVYVASKARLALEVGMASFKHELPADTTEAALLAVVDRLNADPAVHGILVQLPLPAHLDETRIINAIDPRKDVDCLTPENVGKLHLGLPGPVSCTPLGCLMLLRRYRPQMAGLNAIVVGRSNLVGKPMAQLLLRENATVTTAHSRTRDLPELCRSADILVAAVGRPEMIAGDWIKPGATVIDVGINRVAGATDKGRLVGDVAYAEAAERAAQITPVPGGVGPMTVACLLANTVVTASLINGLEPPRDLTA